MELSDTRLAKYVGTGVTNFGGSEGHGSIYIDDATLEPSAVWNVKGHGDLFFKNLLIKSGGTFNVASFPGHI